MLILPNIWDVLGAKLLEAEGFEAIATASASIAFSRGHDDNQEIDFSTLLELLKSCGLYQSVLDEFRQDIAA